MEDSSVIGMLLSSVIGLEKIRKQSALHLASRSPDCIGGLDVILRVILPGMKLVPDGRSLRQLTHRQRLRKS